MSGFTLIEVVAAFVIFAGGVLVVIQLSRTLAEQMEWSAMASEIVVVAQQRLDSLQTVPFASLPAGTVSVSVTVRGRSYTLESVTTTLTGLLKQVDVTMEPGTGVSGPSYSTTGYSVDAW